MEPVRKKKRVAKPISDEEINKQIENLFQLLLYMKTTCWRIRLWETLREILHLHCMSEELLLYCQITHVWHWNDCVN
jgi:hypothetical protein